MTQILVWLGGLALAMLLFSDLAGRLRHWMSTKKRENALKKDDKLDWAYIDNTLNSDRPRRDCERQESLGICTGKECLVYESCDFNIKKVVH